MRPSENSCQKWAIPTKFLVGFTSKNWSTHPAGKRIAWADVKHSLNLKKSDDLVFTWGHKWKLKTTSTKGYPPEIFTFNCRAKNQVPSTGTGAMMDNRRRPPKCRKNQVSLTNWPKNEIAIVFWYSWNNQRCPSESIFSIKGITVA